MTSPEYEQQDEVSFLDAIESIGLGDGLVLSRSFVRLIHEELAIQEARVDYEGLKSLSQMRPPIDIGELVTDEFKVAAEQILSNNDPAPRTAYPFLTIINNETQERVTEVMNIARLIERHELPIHARLDESARAGEVLTLDMASLIKTMAQKVGIDPEGAIIIDGENARPIEEALFTRETHFSVYDGNYPAINELHFGRRGEVALRMLQMDLAQTFMSSRHRITKAPDGYVEAAIRVTNPPDLHTVLLSLIDIAQAHNVHVCYTRNTTFLNEETSTFMLVNDDYSLYSNLSVGQRMLDTAIYSAYLTARQIFQEGK